MLINVSKAAECVLLSLQDGLFRRLLGAVDGFRDFIGAPETQKFNIVLFGGEELAEHCVKHVKGKWFQGWHDGGKASVYHIYPLFFLFEGFLNLVFCFFTKV